MYKTVTVLLTVTEVPTDEAITGQAVASVLVTLVVRTVRGGALIKALVSIPPSPAACNMPLCQRRVSPQVSLQIITPFYKTSSYLPQ